MTRHLQRHDINPSSTGGGGRRKGREEHEQVQELPPAEEHRVLRQALRRGRSGGHGPGAVLHPAGGDHPQHHRHPVPHRLPDRHGGHRGQGRRRCPLHHRRAGFRHGRPGYGSGHRLRPAGAASGAVLPGSRGLRYQRAGRGRRPSGRAGHRHHRRGVPRSAAKRSPRRPRSISW